MSATYASNTWTAATPVPRSFGRQMAVNGPGGPVAAVQWLFKRNCSITPRQLGALFASLCAVSAVIGGFFFWHGAPYVAAFAGIELLAVGAALLMFARHAGDRETLTLVGPSLLVELCHGPHVERTDLATEWLTVEPAAGQGSLVELRGRGRTVHVGRHLRPEWRGAFARELRQALRQAAASPHTQNDSN